MQFSRLCKGPILDVFVVLFHTNRSLGYLIRILWGWFSVLSCAVVFAGVLNADQSSGIWGTQPTDGVKGSSPHSWSLLLHHGAAFAGQPHSLRTAPAPINYLPHWPNEIFTFGEWLYRHPCCDLTTATKPQGKHEGAGSPAGSPAPSSSVPLRGSRCHHTSLDFLQWSAQLHQQQQQHLLRPKAAGPCSSNPCCGSVHYWQWPRQDPRCRATQGAELQDSECEGGCGIASGEEAHTVVREMRQMPMHGVHFAPGPALVLGLQPRVPVLSAEPSGLCHLHVSSQGRLLPLHWWGRGRLLRWQAVLLLALELLCTLVLHGNRFVGAALPDVLFARHWLRQAFAEVLRWHQPPRLPLQKHPGLQGGRGQGLSAGKTGLMMACQKRRVQSDSRAKFAGPSPIAVYFPKSRYLRLTHDPRTQGILP